MENQMTTKEIQEATKKYKLENDYFREQALGEELRARYQTAIFTKMDMFLKWRAISDEYNAALLEFTGGEVEISETPKGEGVIS